MKTSPFNILLATTFLSTSAMAITLEPTLENSAISYSEGTETDYNFMIQEADANGNLTTKYYKIDIDKDKISTSSSISWTALDSKPNDMTNVVEVKLPNNQAKYFKYTYTTPSGYETITESENISVVDPTEAHTYKYVGAAINNVSGNDYGDVENKLFLNNKVNADFVNNNTGYRYLYVYGGAISNQGTIGSVVADFIGNSTETTRSGRWSDSGAIEAYGGAIYNSGTIDYILGNFIANYVIGGSKTGSDRTHGGAIYNNNEIGYITGDFIGNYVSVGSYNSAYGGAIYNTSSTGNITGNFIGNYVSIDYDSFASGGAIYNNGSIGNITGHFIGNYIISSSDRGTSYGGAIYNTGGISNINGDFISNYASTKGGAIHNVETIGDIDGDFIGNYTEQSMFSTFGGAIYNVVSSLKEVAIGDITGDFIGNYASSQYSAFGGAICNYADYLSGNDVGTTTIGNITGDFINNYVLSASGGSIGGAIYNGEYGFIGNITGDFIGNYTLVTGSYGSSSGGAIDNVWGNIGDITGDFIGNYASSQYSAFGGAIENMWGNIGNITGDFIGNHASATDGTAYGGAIINSGGIIGNITGDFIGNYAVGEEAMGGAIFAYTSPHISKYSITIDNNPNYVIGPVYVIQDEEYVKTQSFNGINFDNNKAIALGGNAIGGAIVFGFSEEVTLGENFSSDEIKADDGNIYGPDGNIITLEEFVELCTDLLVEQLGGFATYEEAVAAIGGVDPKSFEITNATFTNNVSQADNGTAMGGGIANIGGNGIISNSSFTNNKAIGKTALGGAIYNAGNLTIIADNYQTVFSGNMANDKDNAIYNGYNTTYDEENYEFTGSDEPSTLLLSAVNGGEIIFNDGIDGDKGYKLTVEGDGEVIVNSTIENVGELNINGGNLTISSTKSNQERRVVLSSISDKTASYSFNKINMVGGNLNFANLVIDEIKTSGLSSDNGTLHIDVDPVKMTSDKLSVDGNVEGTTKLVVHAASNDDLNGKIVFAESVNDSTGNEKSFEISRVYKSPYMYEVKHQSSAENEHEWYFRTGTEENPDYQPLGPIEVAPEVIATVAVKTAGLSQTNGMVYNIMRKVGVNRLFCPGCGFYDYNWDGEAFHNVWVDTTYNGLTIESPVEIEAKVWGIEAGSDLQHDLNNKLGIFVSYRQGSYEMDGKGEKYYSNIGSEIDIDSYLAGLYYRYDYNDWYAFATLYGGMQNAEIQTDDGVANYDTDGIEFGGSIEAGYNYALTRKLSVTPSLGAFYSQISYDDATDNVGKTVNYNDLKQVELEAGAKFAYTQYTDDGFYSLYVKPSVVQTLVDGDEIEVTKLGKVDTVEDQTLGRIEIGGNYGFNDNWSAYGWANYTFGSDYEATSLGLGLNYAW